MYFIVGISLFLLRSQPARAQSEDPRVSVELDACVHVERPLFQHLLDAELELAVDYSGDQAANDNQTTIWLTCTASGVRLYLQDNFTGKSMVRVVTVTPGGITEHSQSRLLALAVAELVAASWTELRVPRPRSAAGARTTLAMEERVARFAQKHQAELVASSSDAIAAPAPSGEVRPAQTVSARKQERATADNSTRDAAATRISWRSGVALEVVELASIGSPWLGVELAAAVRPWPRLQVGLAVQLNRSAFRGSLDGQQIPKLSLTALSATLQLLFVHTAGDFDLSAGIGMRSGFAWLEASANNSLTPRSANPRPMHVPMGVFGASYAASSHVHLGVKLQLGRVMQGVNVAVVEDPGTPTARQASVAAIRGFWVGATLGLEWVF